jgi:hypothetical protein
LKNGRETGVSLFRAVFANRPKSLQDCFVGAPAREAVSRMRERPAPISGAVEAIPARPASER